MLLAVVTQKPNEVTVWPGASCAAQAAGFTVTAVPDRVSVPLQDCEITAEVGKLKRNAQPLMACDPVFLVCTLRQ